MAFVVSTARAWPLLSVDHGPARTYNPANTYYQARPVITMTSSLVTTHWCRVRLVHRIYYPVLDVGPKPNSFMPTLCRVFPCPPIILLTDTVTRSRLLAAHGLTSCLSVRTQPLTATGAPSQTSTIPYHTVPVQIDSRRVFCKRTELQRPSS